MANITIEEYWPDVLKLAAENVLRAEMERTRRRIAYYQAQDDRAARFCWDRFIEADRKLRRLRVDFDDLFTVMQERGEA